MGSRVLFSPVGTTDPFRDDFEGPLLHIIRHYDPDFVYLFLTSEMAERADKDDRYHRAIREQARLLGRTDRPIVESYRSNIKDPSDFDAFGKPYQEIFAGLCERFPDAEILLNVSSGSPQMISAACLLASSRYLDRSYRSIQVLHHREHSGEKSRYMPDEYKDEDIGELMDFLPEAPNRCREPNLMLFQQHMLKEQIKRLIKLYDYPGASLLVEFNPDILPDSISRLIKHITFRLALETEKAMDLLSSEDHLPNVVIIKNKEASRIYEYFLGLQVFYLRDEIGPYLLRLSPLLTSLIDYYIRINCNYQLNKLCQNNSSGASELSKSKIQKFEPALLSHFERKYHDGFSDMPISLNNLLCILNYLIENKKAQAAQAEKVCNLFSKLRTIEEHLRNKVAHQIVKVSKAWCKKNTGYAFEQIHQDLVNLIDAVLKPYLPDQWVRFPASFSKELIRLIDREN